MSVPTHDRSDAAVVTSDGVLGGKPRLDGYRISVVDVVELLDSGHSIDRTAAQLQIDADEVHAAAEYYRQHRDEIDDLLARRRAKHDELCDTRDAQSA